MRTSQISSLLAATPTPVPITARVRCGKSGEEGTAGAIHGVARVERGSACRAQLCAVTDRIRRQGGAGRKATSGTATSRA